MIKRILMMNNKIKLSTSLKQLVIQKSSYFFKLLYLIFQNFNILYIYMLKIYHIILKLQADVLKSNILSISVIKLVEKGEQSF